MKKQSKLKMDTKRVNLKRKSPKNNVIFEIDDNDLSSEEEGSIHEGEPDSKLMKISSRLDGNHQSKVESAITDSKENPSISVEKDNSLNEVPINVNDDEEVTVVSDVSVEVIEEVGGETVNKTREIETHLTVPSPEEGELKEEITEQKPTESTLESKESPNPSSCICITFSDSNIANIYKFKFLKFVQSFVELEIEKSDDLSIKLRRDTVLDPSEWVVVDDKVESDDCEVLAKELPQTNTKKKKRKKDKNKKEKAKELFILDTNPSLETVKVNLNAKYAAKFMIDEKKEETVNATKAPPSTMCFNCGAGHSLKDCPLPKNFSKINAARREFNNKTKSSRYHLEEDQKYAHLQPGKISQKLSKALGLKKNQVPAYIYRMRQLGYPPGWIEEAKIVHSNLAMFDIHGNNVSEKALKKSGLDIEKVIEYHGFNVPLKEGFKDEYKSYNTPPYSEDYYKDKMIEFLKKQLEKEEDNLETCDMELDQSFTLEESVEEISVKKKEAKPKNLTNTIEKSRSSISSPSLNDLEKEKEALLAQINNETNSSFAKSEDSEKPDIISEESQEEPSAEEDSAKEKSASDGDPANSNTSKVVGEDLETPQRDSKENTSINSIKTTSFGTPILKSSSPYSRLPNPDNFMKDVSPVINFENLPNSTGKYEQMTGVLQKVRNTLKHLQNCNS